MSDISIEIAENGYQQETLGCRIADFTKNFHTDFLSSKPQVLEKSIDDDDDTPSTETQYFSYFQISFLLLLFYYLGGLFFFWYGEKAGFIKSIYWTLTLNGQTNQVAKVFEDDEFTPKTDLGKLFSVTWILAGFIVIGYTLGNLIGYLVEKQEAWLQDHIKANSEKSLKRRDLLLFILGIMGIILSTCIMLSTFVYGYLEGWNIVDSFYFAVTTSVAVGESDYAPKSSISQLYGTIMVIITGLIFTTTLTVLIEFIGERAKQRIVDQVFSKKLSIATLHEMDLNSDGVATREEFLRYMLIQAQLVDEEKIDMIMERFNQLDATGDGKLEIKDIKDL
jgi:hypothetical protein